MYRAVCGELVGAGRDVCGGDGLLAVIAATRKYVHVRKGSNIHTTAHLHSMQVLTQL